MSFSVLYTILVVLCADVLAKGKDTEDSAPKKPMHTSENWMIYGPILVAILLILSCVFSCKLRNWYRHNQTKRMDPVEEKEQTVVVAITPETRDPLKENDYRLLTPEYRPQTPQYRPQTPQIPNGHPQTPSFPLQTGSYHPQTPSFPLQTASYHPQTPTFPLQTASYHPQTPTVFPPQTASYRPLTTLSSDHRYLLVTDSGNVSQTTTLTRDERV